MLKYQQIIYNPQTSLQTAIEDLCDSKTYCDLAQVHSSKIHIHPSNQSKEADAIITKEKNCALVIKSADCIALILYDPEKQVLANIHAGWRGQNDRIISKTIAKMKELYGSEGRNIVAISSPSLGKCCSEFSSPKNELKQWMHKYIDKDNHIDLKTALLDELIENKILKDNISISENCTCCNTKLPSWRRNKSKKRIATIAWIA